MRWHLPPLLLLLLIIIPSTGCSGRQYEAPALVSSASSVGYGLEWAARLEAASDRYQERRDQVTADIAGFEGYPEQLSEPDWAGVGQVYREADRAGRSRGMVELLRSERDMDVFVERHGKELGWRVGGHVSSVLQKGGCKCADEGGRAASYAVREAFRRQLDKRRRELNEAHRLLDLGVHGTSKRDTGVLEEQVETLTSASFFVYVEAYDLREEIDALLDDERRVKRTLDRAIEAERAKLAEAEGERTREARSQAKAAAERLELLEEARAPIEEASAKARSLRQGMDEEILALRDAYQEAFDELARAIEERAEE